LSAASPHVACGCRLAGRIPAYAVEPPEVSATKIPRDRHKMSTLLPARPAYSGFVVRGAFVVQLKNVGPGVTGKMEGSVEEVDSGNESQFHSEDELIAFLRECFARSCQRTSLNEGTK